MSSFEPLDAVISGYAYENATTAIGVLEEGRNTKRWISTEMLCTLDNFVNIVLFNERIFLTGCADLKDNYFVPRDAKYAASEAGRRLFDEARIFFPTQHIEGDSNAVEGRVRRMLDSVNVQESPLFVIECAFPKNRLKILQEMVYLDVYFIEYAIEQYGTDRFKPVFPGEHLYLGLRRERIAVPHATYTMANVPGRRLRSIVRERMEKLNAFVAQGVPMLPGLPPIFVSRVLHDCGDGSDFVLTLLKIRSSPAMTSFRKWLVRCYELSRSTDLVEREKGAAALEKLNQFSPDDDLSATDFGVGLLKIAIDVAKLDTLGVIAEIAAPIVKYLGGISFSGLRQFRDKNTGLQTVTKFLKDNFGDQFNRSEMDFISTLLKLPDNLADWGKEDTAFSVRGGRLYGQAPPLARPCVVQIEDAPYVNNAQKDFADLLDRSQRLTPELLRKIEIEEEGNKRK